MDKTELKPLFDLLLQKTPHKVVITTHHKPDGDAMGSTLSLSRLLQKLGHQVQVITPTDYATFLHWLPGHSDVLVFTEHPELCALMIQDAELIFCLDFNDLSRINEMGELVAHSSAKKILIDHHRDPSGFEDYRFWTIQTSSTCELIYDFIASIDCTHFIDKEIATCIYTGIMTDTGSFRFSSTSADTHKKVAFLIEKGADGSDIHQRVLDNFSLERTRLTGYVLYEKLQVFPEYKTALITLTQEELKQFNVQTGDTEGFVNYGLGIEGVVFATLIVDRGVLVKMSFRSKGDFPCNEFASKHFNGGGHLNASGGSSEQTLEETIERFYALLPQYKNQLK